MTVFRYLRLDFTSDPVFIILMTFRKHIGQFLILVMLAAQLALAQHATVHFLEDETIVSLVHADSGVNTIDRNEADKQKADKICQICLYSKSFSHTIFASGIFLHITSLSAALIAPDLPVFHVHSQCSTNRARAPPVFLS